MTMTHPEIEQLLKYAETFACTENHILDSCQIGAYGSYECAVRALSNLVRTLIDPPADLTYNTGILVHWYEAQSGQQTNGPMRQACVDRRPGMNPITSDMTRVTCGACLQIINLTLRQVELRASIEQLTVWRPMETAPRDGTWILATSQGEPYLVRFSAHAWRDDSGVPSPILNGWLPLVPGPEVRT